MRTSNLILPDSRELWEILEKESSREAVHYDYLDLHQAIFESYKQLGRLAKANTSWVEDFKSLSLDELVKNIGDCKSALVRFITDHPEGKELYLQLFDSLAVRSEPRKSDAIFVFGSPSNARIEKAIELYKADFAPKIILSGRGPHYKKTNKSEAARMEELALAAGVPRDSILTEDQSVTLPDNTKRTLDLFDTLNWQPKRLIVVASAFVLRRADFEWYKFTPWGIDIIPVSANDLSLSMTRDGWYKTSDGIAMVLNEYAKLVIESKIDLIRRDRK